MSVHDEHRPVKSHRIESLYVAMCVAAAIGLTWPLITIFTTRIAGDMGDSFQTLWGMRGIRDALLSFRNPFFTHRMYHPFGASLIFERLDVPGVLLTLPLWGLVPEVAIYNTAILLALSLSIYGMFRLVRELTGDAPVAFLAGVLFTATPYQFAHLQGHLHLLAMGWLPLYLVHLLRLIRGTASTRDGVLGGVFLALASLASWYYLLYALIITSVLVVSGVIAFPTALFSRRSLRIALALAASYLVIAGPLLGAMLVARAHEEITGAHDATTFSADLYSFVYPNAAQGWSQEYGAHFRNWSGNSTENATYVGIVMLGLALFGAVGSRLARTFLVIGIIGALLSLGPVLRIDGRVTSVTMPYWYLERVLPPIEFMGVPVRFGYVMYLALTVAAGFGLHRLRNRVGAASRVAGLVAALVVCSLALYEYRPRPLITWEYPVPKPMRLWADDPGTWAVLDVWDWYRPMWHATIHRKPMVGGYLSRVPKRLDDWMDRQPVIHAIYQYSSLSGLSQAEGRAALRDLGVRYVITREVENVCVERELNLPRVYEGEGVRIYEVPAG